MEKFRYSVLSIIIFFFGLCMGCLTHESHGLISTKNFPSLFNRLYLIDDEQKYDELIFCLDMFLSQYQNYVNFQNEFNNNTLVHVSVDLADEKLLKLCLKYKPNLSMKGFLGKTPLQQACEMYFYLVKDVAEKKESMQSKKSPRDKIKHLFIKSPRSIKEELKIIQDKMMSLLDCIALLLKAKAPYHECKSLQMDEVYDKPSLAKSIKSFLGDNQSDEVKKWLHWINDIFKTHGQCLDGWCTCSVIYSSNHARSLSDI